MLGYFGLNQNGTVTNIHDVNFVSCVDVQEAVEDAESQADLPGDAEQLREPQRSENIRNSTATGETHVYRC